MIRNEDNRGFVKATNQGLAASTAAYVCFLNNDAFVTKNLTIWCWDVSKNYFLRIGVPAISSGIFLIVGWIVIKPVYRIKKKKLKTKISTIKSTMASHSSKNYDLVYQNLEDVQILAETIGDGALIKECSDLNYPVEINRQFQSRFNQIVELHEEGRSENAYSELVNLLQQIDLPEYTDVVDTTLISDITQYLKRISDAVQDQI